MLAPGRITSLAGATAGSAEALEGVYNNAAAPAVREAFSTDHFEWEPTVGISLPGGYGGTDFNNRGEKGIQQQIERAGRQRAPTVETTDRFLYLNAGLWAQLGAFGLTLTADTLSYDVSAIEQNQSDLSVRIGRFNAVGAYGFMKNQLCVGAGVRMVYAGISETDNSSGSVISMFGVAPQVGLIVKPEDKQFRVGITGRAPVSAASGFTVESLIRQPQPDGTTVQRVGGSAEGGGYYTPRKVVQPWEIEFGVAYQLGPRPLNPEWINPREHELKLERAIQRARELRIENQRAMLAAMPTVTSFDRLERARRLGEMAREEAAAREIEDAELRDAKDKLEAQRNARYLNWPRERVLLLASVLMTGASDTAVALEGFIDQRRELVGQRVTISPRFGVESEAIPNRLKTRAGLYIEPSRFADGSSREHLTVGFDVRVFNWDVFGLFPNHQWKVSSFVDVSERYQNYGLSAGTWH